MGIQTVINEGIFSFIEGIIIIFIFTFIAGKKEFLKKIKLKSSIFIILYTGFSLWASLFLPVGYHTVAITLFLVFSLSYIVKINVFSTIIIVGITSFIFIITEFVTVIFLMLVCNKDISTVMIIPKIKLAGYIITKGIQAIIIYILYKKQFTFLKSNIFKKEKYLVSIVLLQAFMMALFILSVNYVVSHRSNIIAYNILLFGIFIITILLGVVEAGEREEVLNVQEKVKALGEYVENLELMLSVVRREKHDFSNHLNTIFAICTLRSDNAIDKIRIYLNTLSDKIKESYHFYDTGNSFIDGMFAVKSSIAYDYKINFEVVNDQKLNDIKVNPSDLTSILGNIIDNAFEALKDYDIGEKKVSVYSSLYDDKICISILNNGPKIPEEVIEKIFESGFSTKTDMRDDHGFGLYIVRQLIKRNKGNLEVQSNDVETEFIMKFLKEE